jgi:ArsR family transcriptional regulator
MPVRICLRYAHLDISVKPYIMVPMAREQARKKTRAEHRHAKPFPLDLLFRALADPTRLRLLNLIADRDICVCYFVDILGISQPKISRHLAYLRRAGIAAARRQGRWMHYRLLQPQDEVASSILKETLAHLRQLPEMQSDLTRCAIHCCDPGVYEHSQELKPSPGGAGL